MNNIVRGVLRYTVPMSSVIIENYFDNEVYDANKGFRKGWLPYCEYMIIDLSNTVTCIQLLIKMQFTYV